MPITVANAKHPVGHGRTATGRSRRPIERHPGPRGLPVLRAGRGLATVLFCVAFLASPRAYALCTSGAPYSGGVVVDAGTQTFGNVSAGYDNAVVARNGAVVTTNGAVSGGGGICAETNADVTANGSVAGAYLPALNAMSGASIVANGPVTAGSGGGLTASGGATITLNGITLQGTQGAEAMMANGATIIANGVTINWPNGYGGSLAAATNGGLIEFTANSTITIPSGGFSAAVLLADGEGSRIVADGLELDFANSGGITAIGARNGASVALSNSAIRSTSGTGGGNTGLSATGSGSTITATNVDISLGYGGADSGVSAASGGQVTLTGGSVAVPGVGGGETGLRASGSGSLITASGVDVSVIGGGGDAGVMATDAASIAMTGGSVSVVNGAGGLLQNGGAVTMAGTGVTASGNGGYGFLFNSGGNPSALQYSNGTITAENASFSVNGATADINLANTIATVNNNTLLETTSSGSATFNAQGSTLQGVIFTETGSASAVNLTQGTVWTMTGDSNATSVTNDRSEIIYTPPAGDPTLLASYKTLTAMNYVGVGGTIRLNTYLGDDSAPSDRLVVDGGSGTGATQLDIRNTTGPGAGTVANGILVVDAITGATTTPGAFTLANGELRAGAYDYRLFRGGLNPSNFPNDWFLRSSFVTPPIPPEPPVPPIPPTPPTPPIPIVPPGPPILPPRPPPDPLPPNVLAPIIGPELATYGVVQPLARQLGVAILGTLDDRAGDTYQPDGCVVQPAVAPGSLPTRKPGPAAAPCPLFAPSVWGRFFGQTIDNHYQAFADPRASGDMGGFQGGVDLLRGSLIAGQYERAGLYGAYGDVSADVNGLVTNPAATAYILTRTGSVNLNAGSVGGYWTHVGPGGWYLDTVLQGTWYGGSASTQFARLNTSGTGFIASLEGGVPFALPQFGPGFALEPQGQILWQKVSFRHDYDGLGDVALGDTTGPSGRIGLRGKWTIATGGGQVWEPYLRANLWQDWGADANAVYSGSDMAPLVSRATMLELGGGLTGRLNANISLFANADYEFAVGSGVEKRSGVRGAFGARYMW